MLGELRPFFLRLDALTATTVVDVIVTDELSLDEKVPAYFTASRRGDLGVVAVDSTLPADVSLPADHSVRELLLACRLLTEIVQLRRRQERGDHLQKALKQMALSDPLTGLANRRAWEDELRLRVEEAQQNGRPLCLAMFDLDVFKQVNDVHGHQAGDDVLRAAAKALAANVRSHDFVARFGGDEFGVLLSNASPESAGAIVERMRQAVCNSLADGSYGKVSASAGLAVIRPQDGISPHDLLAAADRALREAKTTGRNQVVVSRATER